MFAEGLWRIVGGVEVGEDGAGLLDGGGRSIGADDDGVDRQIRRASAVDTSAAGQVVSDIGVAVSIRAPPKSGRTITVSVANSGPPQPRIERRGRIVMATTLRVDGSEPRWAPSRCSGSPVTVRIDRAFWDALALQGSFNDSTTMGA